MNPKKINVKLDEHVGEGVYSNLFMISSSPSEFILDFARMLPGVKDAKVFSRVITTPQHTKQFYELLKKNLEAFEKQHGEIKLPGKQEERGVGFKSAGQNS
ncbi:MAG: DUF3467 domain-containing protein [Candidatus Cloacimonetes bacterium]|nr:DUF3467 domain-containing protein [Candidatus Cloacimonadota bacterium]